MNNLCTIVGLLVVVAVGVSQAANHQETDSNKVLTDFIWNKIISASSSSSPTSSSSSTSTTNSQSKSSSLAPAKPTRLRHSSMSSLSSMSSNLSPLSLPALLAMPFSSPSSTSSLSSSRSLSRRSSYQTSNPAQVSTTNNNVNSVSPTSAASSASTSYQYQDTSVLQSSPPSKYFQDYDSSKELSNSGKSQPISYFTMIDQPQSSPEKSSRSSSSAPMYKSSTSYSGPMNSKNYFTNSVQSLNGKNSGSSSSSIYDMLPMPSYGFMKGDRNSADGERGTFQKKRTMEIVPMITDGKYQQPMEPQIIEVTPDDQPIQLVFRSTSTPVQVKQVHTPLKPEEVETSRTEEEPQRVMHQLLRPIIQEVLEVIQPYRRVTQEVRPVLEEVHTVVAKQAPAEMGPGGAHGGGHGSGVYGANQPQQQHPGQPRPTTVPYGANYGGYQMSAAASSVPANIQKANSQNSQYAYHHSHSTSSHQHPHQHQHHHNQ